MWCANAVTYDKTADNVLDVSTRAVLDEISPPQVGAIAVISGLPSLRELGGSLVSRCDVTEGGRIVSNTFGACLKRCEAYLRVFDVIRRFCVSYFRFQTISVMSSISNWR